jgi:hypothetical protein
VHGAAPARLAWAAALAAASPAVAAPGVDPPAVASLRYEEDWRAFCGQSRRPRSPYAAKCVSLHEDALLSLGGELRIRAEVTGDLDLGQSAAREQALLTRALLHADLRVGTGLRVFAQLGSTSATGRAGGDGATDEDRLDLTQGFVDLSAPLARGQATLRAGRQEVALGSSRLVSVRESPNVRRSFDGARILWRTDQASLDILYLQPVAIGRGAFDDRTDSAQALWGAYATIPLGREAGLDIYYLGLRRRDAVFAQGTARERRHSLGARLFGTSGPLDWDLEAVRQFGPFGRDDIRAWTIASDVGWTFQALPWSPRLAIKADIASGDPDPGDDRLGTFNALYPKLPYFTEAGLVAPANIMDLHPTVTASPTKAVELTAGANLLWRHRRADAFYAPPLPPVTAFIGPSRFVGTQLELAAAWQSRRGVEIKAWLVRFLASGALRRAGARDTRFVAASAAVRF